MAKSNFVPDVRLEQIEADVVLVGINETRGTVHIQPFWECQMTPDEVRQMAVSCGLHWNEMDGTGEVRVHIYDFRPGIDE